MKSSTPLLLSTLILLATSSPLTNTARTNTPSCAQILATFDDKSSLPAVSELNPVGIYNGLNYQGFDVLQAGLLGINAVTAESGINVAANSIVGDILQGSPAFIAATVSTFDLQSLYFGCVVNTLESAVSVPEECTIAFTAFKKGSSTPYETVNQQFNPSNPLISGMTEVTFPSSWKGLERVEISIVQALLTSTLSALLIDNVAYKACA